MAIKRRGRSKRYSIAEARQNLARVVHAVELGAPVEVTRRGEPVAVLLSYEAYHRLAGGDPDFWSAVEHFRLGADLDRYGIGDDFLEGLRERSPGRDIKW